MSEQQPSAKDVESAKAQDTLETGAKAAGSAALQAYTGGAVPAPIADMAVDKVAENPVVKGALKTAGSAINSNPVAKKALAAAQPMAKTAGAALGKGKGGGNVPQGLQNLEAKKMQNNPASLSGGGARGTDGDPDVDPAEAEREKKTQEGKEAKEQAKGLINQTLGKNPSPYAQAGKLAANHIVDGMDDEKAGDIMNDVKKKVEKVQKVDKAIKIMQLIAPVLPYIFAFLGAILIVIVVMAQILAVVEKIQEGLVFASNVSEKLWNFAGTGQWSTSEEIFFKNLKDQYEKGKRKGYRLDIPLIAASIHYTSMMNVDEMDVDNQAENMDDSNMEEYDDEGGLFSSLGNILPNDTVRHFYAVANDKLGYISSIIPGQKRLLGHMVYKKIVWEKGCLTKDAIPGYINFVRDILDEIGEALKSTVDQVWKSALNLLKTYFNDILAFGVFGDLFNTHGLYEAYDLLGDGAAGKVTWDILNFVYEIQEFFEELSGDDSNETAARLGNKNQEDLEKSDKSTTTDDKGNKSTKKCILGNNWAYPVLKTVVDTEEGGKYWRYLKNIYVPLTYCYDGWDFVKMKAKLSCTEAQIESMVDEIYSQREAYDYLFGEIVDTNLSSVCSGQCNYDLTNVNINGAVRAGPGPLNDVLVRLMECDGVSGTRTSNPSPMRINGEEVPLIPFEKYILGVTYAEVGGDGGAEKVEAWKAQAVAARSYALTRPINMGKSYKNENGANVLEMMACVEDQVYCDPDVGCSKKTSSQWSSMYPGTDSFSVLYKQKLTNEIMKAAVKSVEGVVITDGNGNIINSGYVNTTQNRWMDKSKQGKSFEDILIEEYSESFSGLTIQEGTCESVSEAGCAAAGDYANWKQGGDAPWANVPLGSSTVGKIGCAATSVAIQIAKSGVPTTISDFNPGTFVTEGQKQGIFIDGSIYWGNVSKIAPTFQYSNSISLNGGYENKKLQIAKLINDGCYLVVQVKNGTSGCQHWVAVDYISNGEVYILDPAGGTTIPNTGNACAAGTWTAATTAVCYKVSGG